MSKISLLSAVALSGSTAIAWAQNSDFQLPRECSERHNVDQSKCVIQDGPPSYPWVHKNQQIKPTTVVPAPASTAPAAALTPGRGKVSR